MSIPRYRGQYGRGVAGILSGIARSATPFIVPALKQAASSFLSSGARALAREAPRALINVATRKRGGRKRKKAVANVTRNVRRKATSGRGRKRRGVAVRGRRDVLS